MDSMLLCDEKAFSFFFIYEVCFFRNIFLDLFSKVWEIHTLHSLDKIVKTMTFRSYRIIGYKFMIFCHNVIIFCTFFLNMKL